MPTRNVDLTVHQSEFIDSEIAEGRFLDASEAIRAGLHLLERQRAEDKARLNWLRGEIQQGVDAIDRGEYIVLDNLEDIDTMIDDIDRELAAEHAAGL